MPQRLEAFSFHLIPTNRLPPLLQSPSRFNLTKQQGIQERKNCFPRPARTIFHFFGGGSFELISTLLISDWHPARLSFSRERKTDTKKGYGIKKQFTYPSIKRERERERTHKHFFQTNKHTHPVRLKE